MALICVETHTRTTMDKNRHRKAEEVLMLSNQILKSLRSDRDGGAGSSRCHYLSYHALGSTCTIMPYSGKGDKQVEEVEEKEEGELEEGREKWWVNKSLIQHIPSLDSYALLNKAFDIGCHWS